MKILVAHFVGLEEDLFHGYEVRHIIAEVEDRVNAYLSDLYTPEDLKTLVVMEYDELPFPSEVFHAEGFIKDVSLRIYEEQGFEIYDLQVTGEQEEDLQEMIEATLKAWIAKHGIRTGVAEGTGKELYRLAVSCKEGQIEIERIPE